MEYEHVSLVQSGSDRDDVPTFDPLSVQQSKENPMTSQTAPRPATKDYAPYYERYVGLVPEGNICELLEQQISEFGGVLSEVPESQTKVLHKPYTWTISQVVGHLIDVERVFGYRAHRFATNDLRPILGMEQNDFVDNLDYQTPQLNDLGVELKCTRRSNLLLFKRLPQSAWDLTGTADDSMMSVKAIAYILVGHVTHHLDIIKRRIG